MPIFATTDSGFFGKGLYSTLEAEYAFNVYNKGAMVLNWVAVYSAYLQLMAIWAYWLKKAITKIMMPILFPLLPKIHKIGMR